MAKYNKFMQLWVGDLLRDTSHLTMQRLGIYCSLIFHYWSNEELPSDIDEVYMITRAFNESVKADTNYILAKYFPNNKHDRIELELKTAKEKYQKRVDAQAASVKKRNSNANSKANSKANDNANSIPLASASDSDSDSSSISKTDKFDAFWKAYPKKKNKGQAEKAFDKIKPNADLLGKIIEGVRLAKLSADWLKDSGTFIPHPSTWLNAKGWEDEFESEAGESEVSDDPIVKQIEELRAAQDAGHQLIASGTKITLTGGYFDRVDGKGESIQAYSHLKAGNEVEVVKNET